MNVPTKLECYITINWKGLSGRNTSLFVPFVSYEGNKVL
jgi:hypothetical protein